MAIRRRYHICSQPTTSTIARRGGAEVAGWTLDRKIGVRFPAYPHHVWALWWQGGKRRLRTSRCPCWGRLGTLNTPSCPWRGCPAAGQNLETGHLSRHYIAEISLNVTLNHNQQQQQQQALLILCDTASIWPTFQYRVIFRIYFICNTISITFLLLSFQLNNLMVVGYDTYHDSSKKGRSVGGVIASLNRSCTRYYSKCTFQHSMQELLDSLKVCMRGRV